MLTGKAHGLYVDQQICDVNYKYIRICKVNYCVNIEILWTRLFNPWLIKLLLKIYISKWLTIIFIFYRHIYVANKMNYGLIFFSSVRKY